MVAFACFLCFLNAAVISASVCLHFFGERKRKPSDTDDRSDPRAAVQWNNLLKYSGNSEGQEELDGSGGMEF